MAAVAWVATGLDATPAVVVLVLTAGGRLSAYVGSAVGELGFLRGIWLDSAQRLAWLEDFAAQQNAHIDLQVPDRLERGHPAFEDVSFAYPGTTRPVLEHVDLALPAGSVVAVVGENGAGKSTLVKLLARMYTPTSGLITADGVDINRTDVECVAGAARGRVPGLRPAGVPWPRRPWGWVTSRDATTARPSARPSTGPGRRPWSRTCVTAWTPSSARRGTTGSTSASASGRSSPSPAATCGPSRLLLMLDEPTAALDAETEHALFERFASGAREANDNGRVTVLVSHRFSTVRMADLIVVLDGARVVEVGTHAELMRRRGTYAELYSIQAESYA